MTEAKPSDSAFHQAMRLIIALWVVLLVLLLYPYTTDPAGPIKHLATVFAALLLAVVWLMAVLVGKARSLRSGPLFYLAALFVGVNLVAALFSAYPAHSLLSVRVWLAPLCIAFFAAQVYSRPEQVRVLFACIVAAVALSSVYGFAQAAGWDPFPWAQRAVEEYRGLPSTYANPNVAGHALLVALILALGLACCRDPRVVVPSLAAALLMATHLWLTSMRGARLALLAAGLMLLLYWFMPGRTGRPARAAFLSLAVLLGLAAAGVAGALYYASAQDDAAGTPFGSSLVLRLNGYHGATEMVRDKPLLGYGPGNYDRYNVPYWTDFEKRWFVTEGRKNTHVHNDALEAAVEAGVPGAMAYLALLLWAILLSLVRGNEKGRWRGVALTCAAAFAAFAVDGLFGFNLRVPVSAGFFFLLLGVCTAMAGRSHASRKLATAAAVVGVLVVGGLGYAEARVFAAESLLQKAKGARHWAQLARADGRTKQFESLSQEALDRLAHGQDLLPSDHRFPQLRARILGDLHRPAEAREQAEAALRAHPHHPHLLVGMAKAQLNEAVLATKSGDLSKAEMKSRLAAAETAAGHALELCDTMPRAHEAMGRVALLRATLFAAPGSSTKPHWQLVAEHFTQALRHGVEDRATLQQLVARAHTELGQWDAAEAALERAVEIAPAKASLWENLGGLCRERGRLDVYVDALNRALKRLRRQAARDAEALGVVGYALAEAYLDEKDSPELARQLLEPLIAEQPAAYALWGLWYRSLPEAGRWARLQERLHDLDSLPPVLNRLRNLSTDTPAGYVDCCAALAEVTRSTLAEAPRATVGRHYGWLAEALGARLGDVPLTAEQLAAAHAALGAVSLDAGQWQNAVRLLEASLAHTPAAERTAILINLSAALAGLERHDDALRRAREAERLLPNDRAVRWNLAQRLAGAGRAAEAKFEYTSLLRHFRRDEAMLRRLRAEVAALEAAAGQEEGP